MSLTRLHPKRLWNCIAAGLVPLGLRVQRDQPALTVLQAQQDQAALQAHLDRQAHKDQLAQRVRTAQQARLAQPGR